MISQETLTKVKSRELDKNAFIHGNSEDNKDAMSMTAGTLDFLKETGALVKNVSLYPVFQHSCIECWNSSFEGQLLYRNICVKLDVVMNGY